MKIKRDDVLDSIQSELVNDFTKPVYLLTLGFSPVIYLSTGPDIIFNTNTYVGSLITLSSFTWTPEGGQTGDIIFLNDENSIATALILGGSIADVTVEIYQTYMLAAGGNTTPIKVVGGVLDASTITPSQVIVRVVSSRSKSEYLPRRYYTKNEGFNFLPTDGQLITWNGENFILEAERA